MTINSVNQTSTPDCHKWYKRFHLDLGHISITFNNPENIMICLITNPIDEDTTYHSKHRHHTNKKTITPNKLCHHIKSPVKSQQNKKLNPTSMPFRPPFNLYTASSLQLEQNSNSYIIENLKFGDEIQWKTSDSFRLISQNVGELEKSNEALTLKEISDNTFRNEVDVAYLSETNTNWKQPKGKYKRTKILQQF